MFDIITSRDFLAKLEADFDDFMKTTHSTRLALNCAMTAYHLHEWVWGDWLKKDLATRKALNINDKNSFLAWIEKVCPEFTTIQQLTNGTKHFGSAKPFKAERVGAPPFKLDDQDAGLDKGVFGGPIPYNAETHGDGCLLIDYGATAAQRWKTAAALLRAVMQFWRDFFAQHHPV